MPERDAASVESSSWPRGGVLEDDEDEDEPSIRGQAGIAFTNSGDRDGQLWRIAKFGKQVDAGITRGVTAYMDME